MIVYCDVCNVRMVRVEQNDDGGITLHCSSGEGDQLRHRHWPEVVAALARSRRKGRPQSMKAPPYVAYLVTHNSPDCALGAPLRDRTGARG